MRIKKTFLLITIITLCVSCSKDNSGKDQTNSNFINIPDVNFETKLIELGIDSDGIINQKLLKLDAIDVENLDVASTTMLDEISDLKGIEGFINLKRLNAVSNDLSEIDLSQNKLLDTLNLAGNNLTFIDLAQNKKLLDLNLSVNNLSLINGLSHASDLKTLNLSFNAFEDYTVVNRNLTNLLMTDNELAFFESSVAAKLKTLNLLTNKLVHIDISHNTILEALNVSNNRLININLGQKNQLNYFSCFSNLISILDVSKLDNLDYLVADRNPSLFCIKIESGQKISTLTLSDYQEVDTNCN